MGGDLGESGGEQWKKNVEYRYLVRYNDEKNNDDEKEGKKKRKINRH